MINAKKKKGFTLIELMVSVALMLILVGVVVMIFSSSSEVFTSSEAKINVFQNARASIELMARELSGANNTGTDKITIDNSGNIILSFVTTTFRMNAGARENGVFKIEYVLQNSPAPLWTLRRIAYKKNSSNAWVSDGGAVLAQYIHTRDSVKVGFFYYDGSDNAKYTDDDDGSTGWKYNEPANSHVFDETATEVKKQVPYAVRITMDITDRHVCSRDGSGNPIANQQTCLRATRTISRTIWLPSATH